MLSNTGSCLCAAAQLHVTIFSSGGKLASKFTALTQAACSYVLLLTVRELNLDADM